MRVLITGGAGFIGSHLAEALLDRGDEVFILDDLSTGAVRNLPREKGNGRQHRVFDSVMNRGVLAELVDQADVIFHLAAAVGVRLIVERPLHTIKTNIGATELVLEAAARKGKRIFVASTSEVYGKNTQVPFTEEADLVMGPTTAARWSYACSKAIDEFLALAYWKEKRLPVVIGRLFNVVGPRQTRRYGMVLPNFVQQALDEKPLTVFGTGQQTRCFSYVTETVEAIMRLVETDQALGQVVNVGSDETTTIEGLAQLVKERTGSRSEVQLIPYDEAYEPGFEDMNRRTPSLEKLVRLTGYRPSLPLKEIVDRVVSHTRQEIEMEAASGGDALRGDKEIMAERGDSR